MGDPSGFFRFDVNFSHNREQHKSTFQQAAQETRQVRDRQGGKAYINKALYDVELYDQRFADGALVPSPAAGEQTPHVLRFVVRDGFEWVVPDGMTKKVPAKPQGLPRTIEFADGKLPDQATGQLTVAPAMMLQWLVGTLRTFNGLVLEDIGVDQVLKSFQESRLSEEMFQANQSPVTTVPIQTNKGRVAGYVEWWVRPATGKKASLERPVYDSTLRNEKEYTPAVSYERALNKSLSVTIGGGIGANVPLFRAMASGGLTLGTSRSDANTISHSGGVYTGREDQGTKGLYQGPVELHLRVRAPHELAGYDLPPHLEEKGTAPKNLAASFHGDVRLQTTRSEARKLGGWDPERKVKGADGEPLHVPELPPELRGRHPMALMYYGVEMLVSRAELLDEPRTQPRQPRSPLLGLSPRTRANSSRSGTSTPVSDGTRWSSPLHRRTRSAQHEVGDQGLVGSSDAAGSEAQLGVPRGRRPRAGTVTGASERPRELPLQLRDRRRGSSAPPVSERLQVPRSPLARPAEEGPSPVGDEPALTVPAELKRIIFDVLHADPGLRGYVAPDPSGFRRGVNRAKHTLSPPLRKAKVRMGDARRAGWAAVRHRPVPGRRPVMPRYDTMHRKAINALRNNQLGDFGFSPSSLNTRMRTTFDEENATYVVELRRPGTLSQRTLVLKIGGTSWEDFKWKGTERVNTRGAYRGGSETGNSSSTGQSWGVTGGADGGPRFDGGRFMPGGGVSYSSSSSRRGEAGLGATFDGGTVSDSGVHVFGTRFVLEVRAEEHRLPRTPVRWVTGDALRKGPTDVPLADGQWQDVEPRSAAPDAQPEVVPVQLGTRRDGALRMRVGAVVRVPDAVMPHSLRSVRKQSLPDAAPVGQGQERAQHSAPPAPPSRVLPEVQARALRDALAQRPSRPEEHFHHVPLRVGHMKPLADLIASLLAAISPKETQWTFSATGTTERQTIDLSLHAGQLESHLATMTAGQWSAMRIKVTGRFFGGEAEVDIAALQQGHHVRHIVDRGLHGEAGYGGSISVGSGVSGKRGWEASLRLSGWGGVNGSTPDALPATIITGPAWTPWQRVQSRGASEGLSFTFQVGQTRGGRQALTQHDSTTYVVTVRVKSNKPFAKEHEAVGGVLVQSKTTALRDLTSATALGLASNGLDRPKPLPAVRPLLPTPILATVEGALDAREVLAAFQRALTSRKLAKVLPASGIRDLGGLRDQFAFLLRDPHVIRSLHDQLSAPEGLASRHYHNQFIDRHLNLGSLSGTVRVRLHRAEPRYRGAHHNVDVEQELVLSEKESGTRGITRTKKLTMPLIGVVGTEKNDASGDAQGHNILVSPGVAAATPNAQSITSIHEVTRNPALGMPGDWEFDVPIELELIYTRDDGTQIRVRESAGRLSELYPDLLVLPVIDPDAAADTVGSGVATGPGADVTETARPDSTGVTVRRRAEEEPVVVPVRPGERRAAPQDDPLVRLLQDKQVTLLNGPGGLQREKHTEAVLDRAFNWYREQPPAQGGDAVTTRPADATADDASSASSASFVPATFRNAEAIPLGDLVRDPATGALTTLVADPGPAHAITVTTGLSVEEIREAEESGRDASAPGLSRNPAGLIFAGTSDAYIVTTVTAEPAPEARTGTGASGTRVPAAEPACGSPRSGGATCATGRPGTRCCTAGTTRP
ncbi:hypothetical protein ACWV95_20140 [Streptomyces albus]